MKNSCKYIMVLVFVATTSIASIKIDHPDLTSSKEVIMERQAELIMQLKHAMKSKKGFELAEQYGLVGEFYQAHEYFKPAEQAYLNAIELAETNSKWHYLLATLYRNNGENEKAKKSYLRAWKYNDAYLPTMIYIAEMLFQEGKFKESKQYYDKVLKYDQKNAMALVGVGKLAQQEGNLEKAIESYKMAIKLQPQANQVNFLVAQAYAALGNQKMAKKYFKLKGKLHTYIYDPLVMQMLDESRSSTYYNDKAIRSYLAKDYKSAEMYAEKAIKLDAKTIYPYITLANVYVSTNRASKASKLLEKTYEVNKEDVNLQYSLGVIEEILDHEDRSIYWYSKVLENDPSHKKASITLASSFMRKGWYVKAFNELKRARRLNPDNTFLLYRQASILAYQNKCKESERMIYDAVKEQPKNFVFLEEFVKIAIHCKVSKQMAEDALNAARNMYNIYPEKNIVKLLALIELKNGNKKNAIDYQSQAIFQALTNKDSADEIAKLKQSLEMFKKGKYPTDLFIKGKDSLYPTSFTKIK